MTDMSGLDADALDRLASLPDFSLELTGRFFEPRADPRWVRSSSSTTMEACADMPAELLNAAPAARRFLVDAVLGQLDMMAPHGPVMLTEYQVGADHQQRMIARARWIEPVQ